MINIPDGDLIVIKILENLVNDTRYMQDFCGSTYSMFNETFTFKDHKCLLNWGYAAVHTMMILENKDFDSRWWRWRDIHTKVYEHLPFSKVPFLKNYFHREVISPGGRRTLSFSLYDTYSQDLEKKAEFRSDFSANLRFVVDMKNLKNPWKYPIRMSLDTGISENPFSKHYFDQNSNHYHWNSIVWDLGYRVNSVDFVYKFELIPLNSTVEVKDEIDVRKDL